MAFYRAKRMKKVAASSINASSASRLFNKPIAVLGAGSWGTALALQLARNDNSVKLWDRNAALLRALQTQGENAQYLPGIPLHPNIEIIFDLKDIVAQCSDFLVVIPSHGFRELLSQLRILLTAPALNTQEPPAFRIAWGTKGLEAKGQLLHEVAIELFGEKTPLALISGPSFAKEVAQGLPAALMLASNNADFSQSLHARLHSRQFRLYPTTDILGVALCGVAKNILAIAVGMSDGLQFGANARSALLTRGLHELRKLCTALGGQADTVIGLAGLGDVVLTCLDDQSRNRRFGMAIGRGEAHGQAITAIGQVVEGYHNAAELKKLADSFQLEMPILQEVHAILYEQKNPLDSLDALLGRPTTPKI